MSKSKPTQRTSQKTLIIAVVAAVVVLGVVVASLLLLRSPERQLASGLANLATAKTIALEGTIDNSSTNGKMHTKLQGVTDKQVVDGQVKFDYTTTAGAKLAGAAQVFADKDALYVKVDQPGQLVDNLASFIVNPIVSGGEAGITQSAIEQQIKSMFSGVAEKVDNKWIKLTQKDLRTADSDASFDCYTTFAQTLGSNKKAASQLASAYRKHKFLLVTDDLKSEGSSVGYRVSIDGDALKQFQAAVKDNDAVKQLGDCGVDILTLGASSGGKDQGVDIWVDKFSSNITRVKYTRELDDGSTSLVDFKLSYDKTVQTAPPKDTVDFSSILPQIAGAAPQQP